MAQPLVLAEQLQGLDQCRAARELPPAQTDRLHRGTRPKGAQRPYERRRMVYLFGHDCLRVNRELPEVDHLLRGMREGWGFVVCNVLGQNDGETLHQRRELWGLSSGTSKLCQTILCSDLGAAVELKASSPEKAAGDEGAGKKSRIVIVIVIVKFSIEHQEGLDNGILAASVGDSVDDQ